MGSIVLLGTVVKSVEQVPYTGPLISLHFHHIIAQWVYCYDDPDPVCTLSYYY